MLLSFGGESQACDMRNSPGDWGLFFISKYFMCDFEIQGWAVHSQISVQSKGGGEEREQPKKEQTALQAGCFP